MSSPDVPRASKVSSSVNVTITAPSFYNLPRKFAPVVAPKPKVNPYKSNSRPETATALPPASAGGCSRARLGRVGETPDTGPAEDFPLPPPPPADEVLLPPPPGDIPPPPPPPPPPPFEDSFPPPPAEEVFPSPPGPLEEEAPTVDWTSEAQAAGSSPLDPSSSIEIEIDSLTNMLNEMQNNDPYKSRLKPSGQAVNGRSETSAQQEPVAPQPCLTGPRMAGDSPAGVGPKPAGVRPTAPRASARPEQSWPGPEARPGGEAKAPSAAQKPSGNRGVVAKEGPGGRKQPEREASSKPSQSSGEPLPLSYKDVEDLEKLATQFMQEMDKEPKTSVRPTEICARCRKDLSRSEAAVRAMGSLFHVDCFLCEKCHQTLQGQQFYEVNGDPLCESCHNNMLEKCAVCQQPIAEKMLRATGKAFHPKCFTCTDCRKVLEGQPFIVDKEGKIYCVDDYHRRYAPKCSVCHEPIVPEEGKEETVRIIALEKNFHVKCYRCEDCSKQLSSDADENGCYPLDGHILCLQCHQSRVNKGARK